MTDDLLIFRCKTSYPRPSAEDLERISKYAEKFREAKNRVDTLYSYPMEVDTFSLSEMGEELLNALLRIREKAGKSRFTIYGDTVGTVPGYLPDREFGLRQLSMLISIRHFEGLNRER